MESTDTFYSPSTEYQYCAEPAAAEQPTPHPYDVINLEAERITQQLVELKKEILAINSTVQAIEDDHHWPTINALKGTDPALWAEYCAHRKSRADKVALYGTLTSSLAECEDALFEYDSEGIK